MKIEIYPNDWIDTKHVVSMKMLTAGVCKFDGWDGHESGNMDAQIQITLLYGMHTCGRQVFRKEIQSCNMLFRKLLRAWKSKR